MSPRLERNSQSSHHRLFTIRILVHMRIATTVQTITRQMMLHVVIMCPLVVGFSRFETSPGGGCPAGILLSG
jgi:hypothetical protein